MSVVAFTRTPDIPDFVTNAMILTVGLAWANAVQGVFDAFVPRPQNSALGKVAYAGVLSIACVGAVSLWKRARELEKMAESALQRR